MTLPAWHQQWLQQVLELDRLQIFFIVGCQKSGTTWLEELLNVHPQIICGGEGHLAHTLVPALQRTFGLYNELQIERRWVARSGLIEETDARNISRLACNAVFAKYLRNADGDTSAVRALGDRTPEHANAMALLNQLYPDAKFIHIIRDGRDGAASGWAHLERQNQRGQFATFADYAEYFAAQHWKPYILNARAVGRTIPERYLELRYEDLHREALPHVQAILALLGVTADDAAAQACIEHASFERLSGGRSRGQEDRRSHLRKGVVGDWVNHFDNAARRRFDRHAADLLHELGYHTDDQPAAQTIAPSSAA